MSEPAEGRIETQSSETPPPVEPYVEASIDRQWGELGETNPWFFLIELIAFVWFALRGRKRPHTDAVPLRHNSSSVLLRDDSSDEDFRAFAAEALRRDPATPFGLVLSQWRRLHAGHIPLRDSLLHVFDEEQRKRSGWA